MMRASKFTLFAAMLIPFALAASADANGAELRLQQAKSNDFLPWRRKRLRPQSTATTNSFQELLTDNTVRTVGGRRISKAEIVKRISGTKCNIRHGWSLTDPVLEKIDDDTYVFTYTTALTAIAPSPKQTQKEASCRSATVWVKRGEKWRAAFPAVRSRSSIPKLFQETLKQEGPKKASVARAWLPGQVKPPWVTAENSIWDAWKIRTPGRSRSLTTADITFVDIFGNYFKNKPDAVKDWTVHMRSERFFANQRSRHLSFTNRRHLTLAGSVDSDAAARNLRRSTARVYVKEGDMWKWAFGFNSPN